MYYNFFLKFWIFQELKFDLIFRFMNMIVVMVLVNITVMVIMMLVIILTVMIIMMTIIILMMTIIGMEMITNTWLLTETAFHRPSGEEGGGTFSRVGKYGDGRIFAPVSQFRAFQSYWYWCQYWCIDILMLTLFASVSGFRHKHIHIDILYVPLKSPDSVQKSVPLLSLT